MSPSLLRRSLGARRWLLADPRDVLEVSEGAAGGALAATSETGLEAGLARQRARIQRSRLGVLLRRHLTLALAAAIVLEALALLGVVPQLVVVVVPLVLLLATIAWALRRQPSLPAVAQLLDARLRLFDRLGTALELERRGAGNGAPRSALERRAVAEAAALVGAGGRRWRPRPVAAPREWAAAGAALLVLAALVVVAVVPGSGSGAGGAGESALAPGEGTPAAGKGARNKEALEHYLGGPSTPPSIHRQVPTGDQIRPAPRGDQAGKRYTGEAYVTPNEGQPTRVQQGFHFEDQSLAEGPVGVQPSGKSQADGPAPQGGPAPAGKAGDGKSAAAGGGKGPGAGGGKQGAGRDAAATRNGAPPGAGANPGTRTPARAPASKAAPGGKTGSSQLSPETGSPGGNSAGNGVGGNRSGRSREIEGVRSQGLKLQAGYAPFRAAKGAPAKGRSGERQGGGGRARSGQVEGAAAGSGSFAFVPATGGAVIPATGGETLAQSYAAALRWLERLPW